jgi:hypothetical protein
MCYSRGQDDVDLGLVSCSSGIELVDNLQQMIGMPGSGSTTTRPWPGTLSTVSWKTKEIGYIHVALLWRVLQL